MKKPRPVALEFHKGCKDCNAHCVHNRVCTYNQCSDIDNY